MPVIEAVYENGVFRPVTPVPEEIRNGARVIVSPLESLPAENGTSASAVRDILTRRYKSGIADTAARHEEHQP